MTKIVFAYPYFKLMNEINNDGFNNLTENSMFFYLQCISIQKCFSMHFYCKMITHKFLIKK